MTGTSWLRQLFGPKPRRLIDRLADPSDDLLRVLVEQAGIGIAIVDQDGGIVRINDSLRRALDPRCDATPGAPAIGIFSEACRARVWADIAPALRGGQPLGPCVATLRPGSGPNEAELTVIVSAVPLCEADGQSCGMILQLTDISAQRGLETRLAQSQRLQAVGQLAAGIAHDFNNLLTAMLGAADEVLGRPHLDPKTLEDVQHIRSSADRGGDLVRQLLAFTRQQTLEPRAIALDDAVTQLSTLLRRVLGRAVQFDLALGAAGYWIRMDPTQLDQVLINLAVNARHAMPDGGRLTLRTAFQGAYAVIEVQDSGMGIAADVLPHIFDPFFTTRHDAGGSGLGLSTVRDIIRHAGGHIEVDSPAGRGTLFRITLPVFGVPAAAAPVRTAPHASPDGRLVLLVDDEVGVRRLTARALMKRGWTVLAAESGDAALALLREDPAQLDALCAVISDVVMPGMDGRTMVQHLRDLRPELPAILTSGYAEEAVRGELGLDHVLLLSKPYTLNVLLTLLESQALPGSSLMIRSDQ